MTFNWENWEYHGWEDPEEALKWWQAGWGDHPLEARDWWQAGWEPETALFMEVKGWEPEQALEWRRAGWKDWNRATKYRNRGYTDPYEAYKAAYHIKE